MHWINEVEIARSIDELVTSRSIMERTGFTDYDMLAMIASALKKLLKTHVHFRKRVSVEEQRAQKYDRFLQERQIAYMIYEYFRATGAFEAVQGLSDLFITILQNDDVQDFDVRWGQAQQQAKFLRKWSSKVFTSQNSRILFSFRRSWLCTTKKLSETMDIRVIQDCRHL